MGQGLRTADRCLRGGGRNSKEAKRRRYERSVPGIPALLQERYSVRDLLHDGVHGQVYLAAEVGSERPLVMKAFRKDAQSFQLLNISKHALAIQELRGCQLRHEYVCRYFGLYESRDLFCVVTEYCDGGSVRGFLERQLRLDEQQAARILTQALAAVDYLHGKRIVHRDLRLEQFLFTSDKHSKLKLCDLLHSSRPHIDQILVDVAKPTVLLFAAPESLLRGEYSAMSDMWSIGCCLFELFYGHPPITGEDEPLVQRIVDEEPISFPSFAAPSDLSMQLLGSLLAKDPFQRTTAFEALHDRWLAQAPQLGSSQRHAEAERCRLRGAAVGRLRHRCLLVPKAAEEKEAAVQSQFSRSLSGTCSHLSGSTPSSQEDMEFSPAVGAGDGQSDPLALLPPMSCTSDTDSEDWQLHSQRSDLESGVPSLGHGSYSDTYVNSETEFLARARGHWDEFDSEFFEEDRVASSCWSEAEYSDWTVDSQTRRELDIDSQQGMTPQRAKPGDSGSSGTGVETRGAGEAVATGEGDHHSQADPHPGSKGSPGIGAETRDAGEAVATGEGDRGLPADPCHGTGEGDRRPPADPCHGSKGSQGSEDPSTTSRSLGLASRHASEDLEHAARDRSESGGTSSGGWKSSSTSSAPWEYERAGTGGTLASGSAKSAGSRPRAAEGCPRMEEAFTKSLASIDECAELAETLGDVTRRSLAAQGAPGTRQQAASSGIIVLSRRSNSSSSAGRAPLNEHSCTQDRSSRAL